MRQLGLTPPAIATRASERIVHDTTLVDPYAWLRADNWQEVLRDPAALPPAIREMLDAENLYASALLDPLAEARATLLAEMRGRIAEEDASVPVRDGEWLYYQRYREGGQLPMYCRRRCDAGSEDAGGEAGEEVLVDGDREHDGHAFFAIGEVTPSPDHACIAWSADTNGSEYFDIRIREDGRDGGLTVRDTDGTIVWMLDGRGFYFVRVDDNHRTGEVFRHLLDGSPDVLIFAETDPAWFVGLSRSESGRYGLIRVSDHASSECHLLDLSSSSAVPLVVEPRAPKLQVAVAHGDPDSPLLYIRTNADGAEDFRIVSAPVNAPGRANWRELVPHRRGRLILGVCAYPDHLVRLEREDGLPRLVVRRLATGKETAIAFAEEAYALAFQRRRDPRDPCLRFTYESPTTPRETYDLDLGSGTRTLRKRQGIPSGHDAAAYATRRLTAAAPDGELVPVTVLHRAGLALDGSAPLLLYGYGAYGHAMATGFSGNVLSLVDRGFVFAIAHVRGGTDKGWRWYEDGKLACKPNSFSDFIAVARHLAATGYTAPGRIVAQGGSAGGMLMGAVANMAPELFAGIIAAVPFVDVLNTMLDAELPLTPPEWLEWGNPITDQTAFETIKAYSPYDNVAAHPYPAILALAGLTDPRVTYWEPAKWVARLRATMIGGGPVLLKTNMGAGHGGAAGRFDRLAEIADQYAFALACVDGSLRGGSPRAAPLTSR